MSVALARKLNLLAVDDDPSIVRLLCNVVERRLGDRLAVHGETDSERAKQWLAENCCDLLISDLEMPGSGGLEMLRYAKGRNAWTQVIFITAYSTWERISEAIEYGASDYLLKPIDQDELIDVLEQQYVRCARWQRAVLGTLEADAQKW
ncbi:MAG TPA: response regulator [Pirellulales bacterium]|jgi:DNA-binding NtrC family response regulator|nr:response regulator [Pirellulales bacterium]